MNTIRLPEIEFEILKDDEKQIVLYDKVVDKIYTCTKPWDWKFPKGSRVDIIAKLTGVEL